jgi:hypothetical protein
MQKQAWITKKVTKILKEGVRKNTMKPVSKNNPRAKVSSERAKAIAESLYKKRYN